MFRTVSSTIVLFITSLLLASCGTSSSLTPKNVATSVTYTVSFVSTWSKKNHPKNFPSNAHFSSLVGATHKDSGLLWKLGSTATAGIKEVAETGSVATLALEVRKYQEAGTGLTYIKGGGIPYKTDSSAGTVTTTFGVSESHPYASVITMLAPSPDWFTGVNSTKLYDATTKKWITPVTVDAIVYDAGTDKGKTFTAANASEDGVITRLTDTVNSYLRKLNKVSMYSGLPT